MPYVLGIDIGRTRGSAAVCRRTGSAFGQPDVVALDGAARWVGSVLLLAESGEVLVGTAAERRAAAAPERVGRAVIDRVGDDVPVLLGGEFYPAESLVAALVVWIADVVAAAEGGHPDRIAVTHPPEWGSYRRGLLHEALRAVGLPGVLLLPTVIAAAEARHERAAVDPGAVLAVGLIGGKHEELAVVHRGAAAFELVTHAPTIDAQAGDHLDDLVVGQVLAEVGGPDPEQAAMAELRLACLAAKERLTVAPEVRVPLRHQHDEVLLTRARFEQLARPVLGATAERLRRLVEGIPADQLAGATLAGGTARVPLLAALAEAALDCPVSVEPDPGTACCRGAALAARPRIVGGAPPGLGPGAVERPRQDDHEQRALERGGAEVDERSVPGLLPVDPASAADPPPRPPVEITPLVPPPRRFALSRRSRRDADPDEDFR